MSEDQADWLVSAGVISDLLPELLRQCARGLIEKAVEAELQLVLDEYSNLSHLEGRNAVVCRLAAGTGDRDSTGSGPGLGRKGLRSLRKRP